MNDFLISLFIDDEMDLDEKVEFVESVHTSSEFTFEALELLNQEKLLRQSPAHAFALSNIKVKPPFSWSLFFSRLWQPATGFVTALGLIALTSFIMPEQQVPILEKEYRFVLYQPQASQPNLIGTFTEWNAVPMQKIGTSGYWALTLKVSEGEHRYSYIVENGEQMADPTVVTRERDDFGGENSVIMIGSAYDPLS